ncbi:alpha-ketoglutaric semialdehyde dehydrogenase GucD [Paenibacillus prosopidis]|uniref:Aldehyde dehydrogenase (NAD+) n=1 Tax=Paenibacillus prosopidis TaxID=630520 RepID=A0A368VL06_9BACL|nr:alpha-ketoglutaric semialdehyde dehydrogenase GucD [Paenibacillus prosopidis]RCW42389.1 aldehyde dehydrogenase (NAD+) [Paenibacillus prosopidis]
MKDAIIIDNYIGGQWKPPANRERLESINPANKREVMGYVANSTDFELNEAVYAAETARLLWRKKTGAERGQLLVRTAELLESRLDEIGETMCREMGKTFAEARGETARGAAILRYYAGEGMRKIGDVIPSSDAEAFLFTTRVPLGVIGVISPWNFPVAIPIWKMAPALIYGNTVVWKPAVETAVTAAAVMQCFHDAGFPLGAVNMIVGSGAVVGNGMANHPGIHGITFTGSNSVGKQVGQAALARGAKYQLEMGGKNPIIIAGDADLDLAVDAVISGGLRSTGQKCTATSRVIVERSIYELFKTKLLEKVATLKVGNGMDPSVWLGPCANEKQLETVLRYIQKGKEEGAVLLYGGTQPEDSDLSDGFYITPAVFDRVESRMSIAQEEIFGPVLALIEARDFEDAITLANDTSYGLSASIYTKNIGNVLSFVQNMEAGLIRVNAETAGVELQAPFGGMKQSSSHSREQGQAAIEFFTSVKTVFIKP